jgi:hypothetical protein
MTAAVSRYSDRAVVGLAAYLRTAIPAALRNVETDLGLTASSMPDPVEVVERRSPADNRSPLVEVFDNGGSYEDWTSRLWITDCSIAWSYAGDGDLVAGDTLARRYVTAIIKALEADLTLGGRAVEAVMSGYGGGEYHADTSAIRHFRLFGVSVHTDER